MMLKARKAAELDEMMQIVGKGKISEKFNDLSLKEIKKAIAEEKNV
jgi:D-arabinose 1-dehydrogenase-like Zn-dependent alcohol dehydrogenase